MSISNYSNAIVGVMLSWLKGLANWVLKLFNLAGSASSSPLKWLSDSWLGLLIVLMIIGIAGDILVWLFRWRPHWAWFRKERIIVNDEKYLREKPRKTGAAEASDDDWVERDFVVVSETVDRPIRKHKEVTARTKPTAHHTPAKENTRPAAPRKTYDKPETDPFEIDMTQQDSTDYAEPDVFNATRISRKKA